ncbi:MAG: biotin transporter BioY [Clostridium sp.]|nr:biotin transporter BioY [Clostridium sp.]
MKFSTKNLVVCAMFAALTCAVAPISIPLPGGVPITLQQVSVMLAGLLLGAKLGFVSELIYLLLGAFGLPVFAGLSGGVAKILGPSGGFLMGYPILAAVCGLIYWKMGKYRTGMVKYAVMGAAMLLGNIVLYVMGLGWFMHVTGNTLGQAMVLCMLPFIPGDILKMVVVGILVPQLERALRSVDSEVFA